ncbi:MAG TPA: hypothetical protein PKO06_10605 [Candidatus Ozemobacteraceae bacterium]|nr:hypothetical protein [Candidatus Ozemobacteraceae bacterium]
MTDQTKQGNQKTMQGFGVILVAVFILLFFVFGFGIRKARVHPRSKTCYANLRVIIGAIEMYNMDHTRMMSTLGAPELAQLVSGKYLIVPVTCPGDSRPRFSNTWIQGFFEQLSYRFGSFMILHTPVPAGSYQGAFLDTTGKPSCSLHGTVD